MGRNGAKCLYPNRGFEECVENNKRQENSEYVLLKYKIGSKSTGVLTMSTDRKYAGLPDLVSSKARCIAPSQALMYVIGSCTRYL